MKEPKINDYKNEILRFCQILTQFKYDEEFDETIKRLIKENLDDMTACFVSRSPSSRKAQIIEQILNRCRGLVRCEYGTKGDQELKYEISKLLVELSECERAKTERREEMAYRERMAKFSDCFYSGMTKFQQKE